MSYIKNRKHPEKYNIYNSSVITILQQALMRHGNYQRSTRFLLILITTIKKQYPQMNIITILKTFQKHFLLIIRSQKKRRKVIQKVKLLSPTKSRRLSIKFFIKNVKVISKENFVKNLITELLLLEKQTGVSYTQLRKVYDLAFKNRMRY